MGDLDSGSRLSIARLILVPAVITLGITVLRLVGELQHWSKVLFNPAAGGGGAIVGISWLPIIFGPYFALKLARAGEGPKSAGKAIVWSLVGLVLLFGGGVVGFAPQLKFPGKIFVGLLMMAASAAVQFPAWPAFAKTLLAYGYAARIPVAILMFFALRGNWGTHYDAVPPEFAVPMTFMEKYIELALVPQLVLWVAYTVIVGALLGSIAVAVRGKAAPPTAA